MMKLGLAYVSDYALVSYCYNVGTIKSYKLVEDSEGTRIDVNADGSVFSLFDKMGRRARIYSSLYFLEASSDLSTDARKQLEKLGCGLSYVIDPRVIRAYILGTWKIKTLLQKDYTSDEAFKEANALINDDLDWTIDEAKGWMEANGYTPLDTYKILETSEEREKLRPWDRLPYPDWKSSQDNKD